jgi:hypothetical protein
MSGKKSIGELWTTNYRINTTKQTILLGFHKGFKHRCTSASEGGGVGKGTSQGACKRADYRTQQRDR